MAVLKLADYRPGTVFRSRRPGRGARGWWRAPIGNGEAIYFGLTGTNLVDNVEVIPFFADERQQYLEYDLARLIHNLSQPKNRCWALSPTCRSIPAPAA